MVGSVVIGVRVQPAKFVEPKTIMCRYARYSSQSKLGDGRYF